MVNNLQWQKHVHAQTEKKETKQIDKNGLI